MVSTCNNCYTLGWEYEGMHHACAGQCTLLRNTSRLRCMARMRTHEWNTDRDHTFRRTSSYRLVTSISSLSNGPCVYSTNGRLTSSSQTDGGCKDAEVIADCNTIVPTAIFTDWNVMRHVTTLLCLVKLCKELQVAALQISNRETSLKDDAHRLLGLW